jgi:pilus assembly protein FimV
VAVLVTISCECHVDATPVALVEAAIDLEAEVDATPVPSDAPAIDLEAEVEATPVALVEAAIDLEAEVEATPVALVEAAIDLEAEVEATPVPSDAPAIDLEAEVEATPVALVEAAIDLEADLEATPVALAEVDMDLEADLEATGQPLVTGAVDLAADVEATATAQDWDPADITGVDRWWNMEDGVTVDAGRVAELEELLGSGDDYAQATAANRPYYSASYASLGAKPVMHANGANHGHALYMSRTIGGALAAPCTEILVCVLEATNAAEGALVGNGAFQRTVYSDEDADLRVVSPTFADTGFNLAAGEPVAVRVDYSSDGNTTRCYVVSQDGSVYDSGNMITGNQSAAADDIFGIAGVYGFGGALYERIRCATMSTGDWYLYRNLWLPRVGFTAVP